MPGRNALRTLNQIAARIGKANVRADLECRIGFAAGLLKDVPFEPGSDGLYHLKIMMPGKHGKGGKRGKGGKKGGGKKGGGRKGY